VAPLGVAWYLFGARAAIPAFEQALAQSSRSSSST
jgi:hypothetical protein